MPPVNGGPEMGTQIWLQNPEPKPWDVLGGGGGEERREAWERRKISPCLGAAGSGINDYKSESPGVSSTSILPWMTQGKLKKPQFQPTPAT